MASSSGHGNDHLKKAPLFLTILGLLVGIGFATKSCEEHGTKMSTSSSASGFASARRQASAPHLSGGALCPPFAVGGATCEAKKGQVTFIRVDPSVPKGTPLCMDNDLSDFSEYGIVKSGKATSFDASQTGDPTNAIRFVAKEDKILTYEAAPACRT